jgi:hypothetical protein
MAQRRNRGLMRMAAMGLLSMPGGATSAWACPPPAPPAEEPEWAAVAPPSVQVKRDFTKSGPLDLATDGFFVLETWGFDASRLSMTTMVTVTAEDGAVVPGKLRVFEGTQSYVGWEADSALSVGTKLTIVVEGATVEGFVVAPDRVEAIVSGEPAMLDAGSLAFSSWLDFRHGVGPYVDCAPADGPCSSSFQAPTSEVSLPAASSAWSAAEPAIGFTLWEVKVEAEAPEAGVASGSTQLVFEPSAEPLSTGMLVFAKAATEFCARVSVKDLRSGTSVTARHCEERGAATETYRDFLLGGCTTLPSPELTEAWCAELGRALDPVCTGGPVDDPMPNRPLPNDVATDSEATRTSTSTSCQMAVVGASAAGGVFAGFGAMVGFLALVARRKRSY